MRILLELPVAGQASCKDIRVVLRGVQASKGDVGWVHYSASRSAGLFNKSTLYDI